MLHYLEFGISHMEVPGETTLCIYISGCSNRCPKCHYVQLQDADVGEVLSEYFDLILNMYHMYTTCVCFMGEGDCSAESIGELRQYVLRSHARGYKCCLYSGRDTEIEEWMKVFDYLKIGSYNDAYGPLTSKSTNQKMYMRRSDNTFIDITYRFWT